MSLRHNRMQPPDNRRSDRLPIDPSNDGLLYCVGPPTASGTRLNSFGSVAMSRLTLFDFPIRSRFPAWLGFIFAWGLYVLATSDAVASCGDHLASSNRTGLAFRIFEAQKPVAHEPRSCTGPLCQRLPESPVPSVPLPPSLVSPQELALQPIPEFIAERTGGHRAVANSQFQLEDHRQAVDRPPRSR
jgi:hypothetical protein